MLNFKAIMFFINFIFINKMYFSSASEIVTDWSKVRWFEIPLPTCICTEPEAGNLLSPYL